MKLSKYVALAKRGYCKVIHVQNSGIWLGLKRAIYRAVELPDIHGEGQARAVLDIPEKAWGNTFFEEENAEGEHDICGFDMTGGAWELPAEELELQVNYKGVQATALRCTNGELLFYDSRMAAPVSDVMRDSEYVQTVIRKRRSGQRVVVIRVYLKTPQYCSILPKSTICCVAFACIPQRSAALMRLASGTFWRISQHF